MTCTQNTDRECREEDCCLTKKTKLIPFDWNLYVDEALIVCRNPNYKVKNIIRLNREKLGIQLLITYSYDGFDDYHIVQENGIFSDEVKNHYDIFIKKELEEKTFYVNIYSGGIEPHRYESLEDAQETVRKDNDFYQGTLKVTYTEEDLIK